MLIRSLEPTNLTAEFTNIWDDLCMELEVFS
jgi:hypothetical protein